jgi:hypothetical protein
MKLFYRGAQYEAHFEEMQSTATEQIGTYRGAPLKGKAYKVADHPHARVQLTYRGVKYSQ